MKLIATILCGPDLSNLPRAVASISGHVDQVILIDTVASSALPDERGEVPFREELGRVFLHQKKLVGRYWPWQNRFDAARNEALALAVEAGGTWAVTLDADEFYDHAGLLRDLCENAAPEVEAIHLRSGEGARYYQPRVIRLPCARRWVGRTHEAIDFGGVTMRADSPRFHTDPKTTEQIRAKSLRDLPLLLAEVAEKPDEARWYLYLGHTYSNLGEGLDGSDDVWGKAIDAYLAAGSKGKNREERALSFFYAARIMVLKRLEYEPAIEFLMHAMTHHAGIPEIPLLAGHAYLRLAALQGTETSGIACVEQALFFAQLAEVHGEGSDAIDRRILHVDPDAASIGPLRLMAEVYRVAGATDREAAMRKRIEEWGR